MRASLVCALPSPSRSQQAVNGHTQPISAGSARSSPRGRSSIQAARAQAPEARQRATGTAEKKQRSTGGARSKPTTDRAPRCIPQVSACPTEIPCPFRAGTSRPSIESRGQGARRATRQPARRLYPGCHYKFSHFSCRGGMTPTLGAPPAASLPSQLCPDGRNVRNGPQPKQSLTECRTSCWLASSAPSIYLEYVG
ncbi:hypothetical protein NDU88_004157 [Pleurodeles waltl]|uniref:Uncharacterized protein n=1 Tax=Pleurodeles waltl TaxID=8319 RepID=A0AAV7M728_PLEWA|nr:hypothetical protein NDU88_004157 [Pleurodeles waltl]